jgi:hypothetical protein
MALAIKAIPTLKGKEAREFLRRAEEAECDFKGNKSKGGRIVLLPIRMTF